MPSRLGEEGQHGGEDEGRDEEHPDGDGVRGTPVHREVVEDPDRHHEHDEDEAGDDQRDEGVDASPGEVMDVGVVGLGSCLLWRTMLAGRALRQADSRLRERLTAEQKMRCRMISCVQRSSEGRGIHLDRLGIAPLEHSLHERIQKRRLAPRP